jgi:hypothetical protein
MAEGTRFTQLFEQVTLLKGDTTGLKDSQAWQERGSCNSRNPTPTATRDNRDTRKPAPHSAADRDIDTADRPIDKGSYPRTNHTLGISKV